MTDAAAGQMAEGGFNVVWCTEKELDVAHRHGLRAQLQDGLLAPATLDSPALRNKLDALINRVRRHPALYSYFITDEPSAPAFAGLGKLVAYLRQRDPDHLAYINLFPTYASNEQLGTKGDVVTAYREHLRQYLETVKPALVSYDHYQFAKDGDTAQYFLNLAMIRRAAQDSGVPFLNIVQACTWTPSMRVPGANEMRYLVYTTLAYGRRASPITFIVRKAIPGGSPDRMARRRLSIPCSSNSTASSWQSPRSCSPCGRWRCITRACRRRAPSRCPTTPRSASIRPLRRWRTNRRNGSAESCSAPSASQNSRVTSSS